MLTTWHKTSHKLCQATCWLTNNGYWHTNTVTNNYDSIIANIMLLINSKRRNPMSSRSRNKLKVKRPAQVHKINSSITCSHKNWWWKAVIDKWGSLESAGTISETIANCYVQKSGKRQSFENFRKENSYNYSFKTIPNVSVIVCKNSFLATLGYSKNNNIVHKN